KANPNDPSPVVGLLLPASGKLPKRKSVYNKNNYAAILHAGKETHFNVKVTNCAKKEVHGTVKLKALKGWNITPRSRDFKLQPGKTMQTKEFKVTANKPVKMAHLRAVIATGDFPATHS